VNKTLVDKRIVDRLRVRPAKQEEWHWAGGKMWAEAYDPESDIRYFRSSGVARSLWKKAKSEAYQEVYRWIEEAGGPSVELQMLRDLVKEAEAQSQKDQDQ
jgi:hypothetical protein